MAEYDLSACIVLYHTPMSDLRQVMACLKQSSVPADIYLVNNGPDDENAAIIRENYPDVTFLQQRENLGFGKGNNAILPYIKSRYHLIVNADASFEPDLLEKMIAWMNSHPDAAVLTPRVLNPDGTEQLLPKKYPTVRYLLSGFLEEKSAHFRKIRREYTMADADMSQPTAVHFATGCFLLIRTEIFRQLNGFDERFFMYQEDCDLSRRVDAVGKIIYHPDFCIVHAWKRENTRTASGIRRQVRSIAKYFRKWGLRW